MARQYVASGLLILETGTRQWNARGVQLTDTAVSSAYSLAISTVSYALSLKIAGLRASRQTNTSVRTYSLSRFTASPIAIRKASITWAHYHASDGWLNWNPNFGSIRDYNLSGGSTITPDIYVGQTVSVAPGTWDQPVTVAYQWYQDGVTPISGAINKNYTTVLSDGGHYLACAEIATPIGGGPSTSQMSNLVGPVHSVGNILLPAFASYTFTAESAVLSTAATSTLSAPTLGYPTPASTNPTTISVDIGADWQSGDVLKLARSASTSVSSPTIISHTLTDADVATIASGNPISIGLSSVALSGPTYFQAYGAHSGADSINKSNIVSWGDTTAPVFSSAASTTITETIPLLWQFTFTTSDITEVDVYTGPDQLQFETFFSSGSWYARGLNNKAWSDSAREDQGLDGVYNVTFIATDYGGNQTTQDFTMTVQAADLDPTHFTFTPQSNVAKSTTFSPAENPITVSGLSIGVNANASINIGQYNKNNTGWVSAGTTFTVQNGDTIAIRQTSSAAFLTSTTQTLTVGSYSANFVVTTLADPNAASFNPSSTQPAAQTLSNFSNVSTWTGIDFAAGYPLVFVPSPPGNRTVLSVKVNGVSLTSRLSGASGNGGIWVGTSPVTAGTYNVVIAYSDVVQWVCCMTGTVINSTNPVPTGTAEGGFGFSNTLGTSSPLTIPAEGVGIAFVEEQSTTDSPSADTGTLVMLGMFNYSAQGFGSTTHNNYNGAISRQVAAGSWTPSFTFPGLANYVHVMAISFAAA